MGLLRVGPRRWLAAAVVAGVLAAVVAAPAAAAQQAPAGGFADVDDDAFYADAVRALAEDGVFAGTECAEGFCGDSPIYRKTMAVWLVRILDGDDSGAVMDAGFTDLTGEFHDFFINRLAMLGITRGCTFDTFCPNETVTRIQMAVFLSRAFDLPTDADDAGFTDVGGYGEEFQAAVNSLAASGVTVGCTATEFCPDTGTTRAQMAVFLARATGAVPRP